MDILKPFMDSNESRVMTDPAVIKIRSVMFIKTNQYPAKVV